MKTDAIERRLRSDAGNSLLACAKLEAQHREFNTWDRQVSEGQAAVKGLFIAVTRAHFAGECF
jgi:hypothetical protein